jgi:NAD+-dependent protein deacetylase SIR2
LEGLPDSGYYQLLGHAISRELNKRRRLKQYKDIDDAARLLRERKNIMVITGAGVSGIYVRCSSCTLLPVGGMSEPYISISTESQVCIITRMLTEDTRFLQASESLISVQKNTGFYSKLQEMGFSEPEQVFDIHNFDEDPT